MKPFTMLHCLSLRKSDVKVIAAKEVVQNLETVLEDLLGKKSVLLDVGYSGSDIGQFDSEIASKKDALRLASEILKELECLKACERMTERYAYDKLRVSREESHAFQEGQGLEGKESRSILVMLKSLESLIPAFEQQILRMEKGGVQSSIHNPFPRIQTPQRRLFPSLTLVLFAICGMNVMSIWQLVVATPTIPGVSQNIPETPLHV
jgi:hypothetical protein